MAERKGGGNAKEKSKAISSSSSNGRSGKHISQQDICVGEELKIAVGVAVERFQSNEAEKDLEFPSSLTANERAYVHRYCQDLGLISKSRGKGNKRFLTIYKVKEQCVMLKSPFNMTRSSMNAINNLLSNFPVTSRDRHELSGQKLHNGIVTEQGKILARENRLVLGNSPHVPPESKLTEIAKCAENLPIFQHKEEILKSIAENQVVMITGDTGSGKTTQVGQFILENSYELETPCRIICTQPCRLSAISISERVADQRGERIGQTVGYKVRLDSKLSSKTLLQFCTNGVLLRLLMVGHKCLSNITHIIVDEIHERDCYSDYLLIILRDLQKTYKKLKIILMSAALNIDLFNNYFGSCPIIQVAGSCFDVKTYFLEDILQQTGYLNNGMQKMLQDDDKVLFRPSQDSIPQEEQSNVAEDVRKLLKDEGVEKEETEEEKKNESEDKELKSEVNAKNTDDDHDTDVEVESDAEPCSPSEKMKKDSNSDVDSTEKVVDDVISTDKQDYSEDQVEDTTMCEEMDSCLAQAWLNGDDEAFDQIIHLVLNENVNADYQHSETKMTALIVAAARGNITLAEQLIELGAQLYIRDPKNNRDALDWARHFNQEHVADHIQSVIAERSNNSADTSEDTVEDEIDDNGRRRLELYHKSFDDQHVDISLILSLLTLICKKSSSLQGAILIFLPGYDEIITLCDRLVHNSEFSKHSKYQILMLHSMIPPANQRKVFGKPPKGVRKIILSTNLAETSLTIEDVVYVIDSGKVKEKSHDAISSVSTLRTVWISKASAIQRRGRAGRCSPGICYHLFSQDRFHHFQMYQDAEILRVMMHELCLQTKMLVPVNVSISDYLSKAPEPPSNLMMCSSIRLLKNISALDENEDMTDLGKLLVEIPIDPQLGKMILVGMTLKCLESAVVIACCSAYKEPFVLPTTASQKSLAGSNKLRLSADSYSDQIAMLQAFQGWQHAKKENREKSYCSKNYISPGTMEMVSGMHQQIITQLRSLGFIRPRGPGNIRDLNTNSENWSVVKAVIGAGLYPNFIQVDHESALLVSEKEKKVNIHNSSVIMARNEDRAQSTMSRANKLKYVISNLPFDWLVYEELSRLYYSVQIRSVSVLSSVATALVGGPCLSYEHSSLRLKSSRDKQGKRYDRTKETFFQESDSEQEEENEDGSGTFKIDDLILFTAEDSILYTIAMLRIKFLALFTKHIQIPAKSWSTADDAIVQCIANILTKEEQLVGITNPATKDIDKRMTYGRCKGRYGNRYESSSTRGGYPKSYNKYDSSRRYEKKYPPDSHRRRTHDSDDDDDKISGKDDDKKGNLESRRRPKRYFIMKCNNDKNMGISFERNIWATTKGNEKRLNRVYNESDEVYLVFSRQGSGHFQGVAKMVSAISDRRCDDFGSANLGGVFEVDWLYKEEIPFQYTQHLTNPWNDNKKVQISRDTQELEPNVGEALVQLWDNVPPGSPHNEMVDTVSADESATEELNEFYSDELYTENDPAYVEGYPLYSPPPFSPQYMPDFQHVPPHFAPPPPHMAYQQPYHMYAPTGNMSPYRQQEYYPAMPQYAAPRRNTPHNVYTRNGGSYQGSRQNSDSRSRGNYSS